MRDIEAEVPAPDEAAGVDEAGLARRAARGETLAFEELARRFWDRIARFAAVASGGEAELAEEIAQETLVRLHGALPRFRGDSSLGTFVYRICRNAAADAIRRRRRERRHLARLPRDQEGELASPEAGPEAQALRADAAAALGRALGSLEPAERALVYLRESEGLGVAELARVFGLPEGTVKSRLSRARARLRKRLEEDGYGIE